MIGPGVGLGIAGLGVGIAGSIASAITSAKEAKKQRKFIRQMRATAYQATMKDMRAAGLNPILAYRTGPTSTAGASMGLTPDFGQGAAAGMQAGVAAGRSKSEIGLKEEQKGETRASHILKNQQQGLVVDQRTMTQAQTRNINANSALAESQIPAASARATYYRSEVGTKATIANEAIRGVSGALQGAQTVSGGRGR